MTIMEVVAKGLQNKKAVCPTSAPQDLGDRSKYIGASAATGCLRKSYLDVVSPKEITTQQAFIFERGHQLENMIRKGLNGYGFKEYSTIQEAQKAGGLNLLHQLEVRGKEKFDFLLAHIDFVFCKKDGTIMVAEIKSAGVLPEQPWASHLSQLELQMWLLNQEFEIPVTGVIVYHNWETGKSVQFEITRTKTNLSNSVKKAAKLWNAFLNKNEPEAEIQLYCSSCQHKGSCPALKPEAIMENEEIQDLIARAKEGLQKEKEAKKIKADLMAILKASGLKSAKIGDYVVSLVSVQGRAILPIGKIKKEHIDIYESQVEISNGYEFIKIT